MSHTNPSDEQLRDILTRAKTIAMVGRRTRPRSRTRRSRSGAQVLWLQLGVTNDVAAAKASAAGLTVIMDKCIGATHHALHIAPRG